MTQSHDDSDYHSDGGGRGGAPRSPARRRFLIGGAAAGAAGLGGALAGYYTYIPYDLPELAANHPDTGWRHGRVMHVLPTVSHDRMLLKVSLRAPEPEPPRLRIADRSVTGARTDTAGRFWQFHAEGLEPAREYQLELVNANGQPLADPWPLSTFPHPDDRPERFRLLLITCAGGHDAHIRWFGAGPLPLEHRKRLLNRALSFQPDALVSTGDQIYYDLRYGPSAAIMAQSRKSIAWAGQFDYGKAALGTDNEAVLKRAVDPQIAYLYGTAARSVPSFFILDDHDFFENDEATSGVGYSLQLALYALRSPFYRTGVSFPPDPFMLDLGRSAQKLYLPEHLPAPGRPIRGFPATAAADRAPGVSEAYGTLRYGRLVEGLLVEGRRFLTLDGDSAVTVHPAAERWLTDRLKGSPAQHVVSISALPFGWSAGKWLEWYPDVVAASGALTRDRPKPHWQPGWFDQHQRLLRAVSDASTRVPLILAGDLHQQGAGRLLASAELDLRSRPVETVCTGPLGTGPLGWPSSFRGTVGRPPTDVTMEETLEPLENNGFVIADFTPETVTLRFFSWRATQSPEAIDELEPHHVVTLPRDD